MRSDRNAFTMIELLMVIVIIAVLGSTAAAAFIDMRQEARIAALRYNLGSIRSGYKNQMQQVILRCNITWATWSGGSGLTATVILGNLLSLNDVTGNDGLPSQMCDDSEIPNPSDRYFVDMTGQIPITNWEGVDEWENVYPLPQNSFAQVHSHGAANWVQGMDMVSDATLTTHGGKCGWITYNQGLNYYVHWVHNNDTGEIFPGTNTPGVEECNF